MNKIVTTSYKPIETGSSSDKYVLSENINSASELRADFNLRRTLQTPTKNIIPCTHEMEISFSIYDLGLYHLIIPIYTKGKQLTNSKGRQYVPFNIQGKEFRLWSYIGGLYPPGKDELAFEYGLSWQDSKGNSKISYHIHPTFGKGTRTKEGKINNLPEATNIKINSSYCEPKELLSIFEEFLKQIRASRFIEMIDLSKGHISALALYVRYHESKEYLTKLRVETMTKYAPTKGVYKYSVETHDGNVYYTKIIPPNWEFLGFEFPFGVGLKSYRIRRYEQRVREDPLRHPKMEVSITKDETKDYPTLDKFDEVKATLKEFLINTLHWCGIKGDDLIEDDYFKKVFEEKYINFHPWIESEYDKRADETEKFLNELPIGKGKAMDILTYLSIHEFVPIRELAKKIGLSYRQCSRYIDEQIDKNVLDKEVEEQAYVFWKSHGLRDKFIEAIHLLSSFNIPGIEKLYGATKLNPIQNELIRNGLRSLVKRVDKKRKGIYDFVPKPILEIPAKEVRKWSGAIKDFKKEAPNGVVRLVHRKFSFIPANKYA